MADVFLSYSSETRERAKSLVDVLEAEGFSVWWDRQIDVGSSFHREIERQLDRARCVVVVWSEDSIGSDWVINEASEGLQRGVLVPLRIDDVRPPLAFRHAQTADFVGWPQDRSGLPEFLNAVHSRLDGENHVAEIALDRDTRGTPKALRPGRVAGVTVVAVVVLAALMLQWGGGGPKEVEEDQALSGAALADTLVQAGRFADDDRYYDAWLLLKDSGEMLTTDPATSALWERITIPAAFRTDPLGAGVAFRPYAADRSDWHELGVTPLEGLRLPLGVFEWRVERVGYVSSVRGFPNPHVWLDNDTGQALDLGETVPLLSDYLEGRAGGNVHVLRLQPEDTHAVGMLVQAARFSSWFGDAGTTVAIPEFWIDRYEVTSAEYAEFVTSGGYEDRRWWEGLVFRDEDGEVPWQDAVARFVDQTGQPGPATWDRGSYRPRMEDHPVAGVSWYEAMAYARFRQRQVPTLLHWEAAAFSVNGIGRPTVAAQVRAANIEGEGTWPVGRSNAVSASGAYDMAGNVREWTLNEHAGDSTQRFLRGSSWQGNPWMFVGFEPASAFDRSSTNGIRLAKYARDVELEATSLAGSGRLIRDLRKTPPAEPAVMRLLLDELAYEPAPVQAQIVEADDEGQWRTERVTLDSGYHPERFEVLLVIPRDVPPPWQAVVYVPGAGSLFARKVTGSDTGTDPRFIVSGGRVLVYPEWFGTFSRQQPGRRGQSQGRSPERRERTRTFALRQRMEFGRILDFIFSREDLDDDRVALMGISQGGVSVVPNAVTEDRLKALVITSWAPSNRGPWRHPIADSYTLAPGIELPTLLIAGRQDPYFTYELEQVPFMERLGTSAEHKHHVAFDGVGHAPLPPARTHREVNAFLDRYLGPVGAAETAIE